VKLVHEVKQEAGSRDEASQTEESSDFQRKGGRWTSKYDNIRGTSIIVSL